MRQLFKYITIGLALGILPIVIFGAIARLPEDSKENSPSQANELTPKRHGSSERYPTPQEMQQLMSEFQRQITRLPETIKIAPVYSDRRSPLEKQQYESFIQAWTKIDPTIAPFLGSRQIIEDFLVYPSRIKGRVCIIQPYFFSEKENGVKVAIGKVENDRILTDAKQIIFVKKLYGSCPSLSRKANRQPSTSSQSIT